MKFLTFILSLAFASLTFAADAPKAPEAKPAVEAKKEVKKEAKKEAKKVEAPAAK